jgi:hypothetical protein
LERGTLQCEGAGAGLLLDDAPGPPAFTLHGKKAVHQLGPLDSRLRFDDPALGVELEYFSHGARVEQDSAIGELLATHGVAAAANANRLALRARGRQRLAQRRFGIDIDNAVDAGGIELRVDVVDDGRRARLAGNIGQQREAGSCPCGTVEELASGRHVGRYRAAGFNNPRAARKISNSANA